jgi:hypothetical protein
MDELFELNEKLNSKQIREVYAHYEPIETLDGYLAKPPTDLN